MEVYKRWGDLHTKDSFPITPGHDSPPFLCTLESCGLWSAFSGLGTSRKIKSELQEGIK